MIRKSFKMYVNNNSHSEYKKRHENISNGLVRVLKSHGVHNYSIFLDEEQDVLFAYVEIENEELWNKVSETDECKSWWFSMKDVMKTNADNSPISKTLKEVFHLE